MLFTRSAIALLIVSLLVSCESKQKKTVEKELDMRLIGEWRNVSLNITMFSYKNRDTVNHFDVKDGEWTRKMNIQPIRTFFWADHTYNSEHRDLTDSVIYNPAGNWKIVGDTLVMQDTFPQPGLVYRYKLEIGQDVATFTGQEDCDGDGKADDLYVGVQRKQKPPHHKGL